jgi:hypothetical protein
LHLEVSQVGNGGELTGRDLKRIMGAAVLGTLYEIKFILDRHGNSYKQNIQRDFKGGQRQQWKKLNQNGQMLITWNSGLTGVLRLI